MKYYMDFSYDIIYKSDLIAYTADKDLPSGDQMETLERKFVKHTFYVMGNNNQKILFSYFGNKEIIVSHMIYYFNNKITNDKLLKNLTALSGQ